MLDHPPLFPDTGGIGGACGRITRTTKNKSCYKKRETLHLSSSDPDIA